MEREQFLAHARVEDRHWWFTARRRILRRLVARVAEPGAGISLVDLGCGTGGNAAAFAGDYRVIGLDPSPDAIALARERFPQVDFIRTDDPSAGASHLERGGVIVITDVLEHVVDDRDLLGRAVDALPPGGHVIITVPADPALWSRHDVQFGHHRRYELHTLRALWHDLPVSTRLLTPFNARLRPVIASVRRFTRDDGSDLAIPSGPLNGLLHMIFAGESDALVRSVDTGRAPFRRGVSLAAVLRKQ